MSEVNICLACDNNYARYAAVVIASVLANTKNFVNVYILDGGVDDENKNAIFELKSINDCNIVFVPIDISMFEDYKKVATHKYITIATYYRLKLAQLLPDVKRIIYFDCDMVVNTDLSELFNTDLENNIIAGVKDINKRMLKKNPSYINAGMVLFDLDKIRKNNIEQEFYEWTNNHFETIKTGDQEIINEVLKGKIKIVDDEWNVQSSNFTNRSSYTKHPKVIHFVARKKPWHFISFSYHRRYYFKYLQLTKWRLTTNREKFHWYVENEIRSLIAYFFYRPFFMFRPRFYLALFKTYLPF